MVVAWCVSTSNDLVSFVDHHGAMWGKQYIDVEH
jgi:hypothetical protein